MARLTEQFAANHDTKLSESAAQHGPLVNIQALTRNEFKSKIKSFTIRYGQHPTPFGDCLVGITKHGICSLEFIPMDGVAPLLKQLAQRWPDATLLEDRDATAQAAQIAFSRTQATNAPLNVFVQGTHFQIQVWRALLQIPSGHVCSYTSIAQQIGRPQAVRAVGSAIAANPIAWLIPCHRVLRSDGRLSGYHWGETRKQACLAWEAATMAGTV
ncbi:methylated-DNA--[protein]-cysteine S-methyltransferase [Coraliomargarita algicola]|uniref:Methylated-DNA--[protein]-cysteine S-methyltransferase n=1 Tax=Coraliomargarita algicola TaxID=3092156 RepID=A0ABZ0RRV0_9BACT|nr:methylated-DNA--[protein]-cysteine S-methyltransferase [Coraliomargarita sp. J2-16]WPJ97823.1 methylated-DNA--[protein]-cysteine S-methyltransferase [Coraliomargarita sp. J2-16]